MTPTQIKNKAEELDLAIREAAKRSNPNDWPMHIHAAMVSFLTSFHAQVRNETIEECAKKCDGRAAALTNLTDKLEAEKCASAIRSLKSIQPEQANET